MKKRQKILNLRILLLNLCVVLSCSIQAMHNKYPKPSAPLYENSMDRDQMNNENTSENTSNDYAIAWELQNQEDPTQQNIPSKPLSPAPRKSWSILSTFLSVFIWIFYGPKTEPPAIEAQKNRYTELSEQKKLNRKKTDEQYAQEIAQQELADMQRRN
jgi:hypothetical protein